MPYLGKDLAELIKSLMRRFVKREVLQDITTAQLTKLDIVDQKNLMPVHCVDIGLGAEEPSRDCLNTLPADGLSRPHSDEQRSRRLQGKDEGTSTGSWQEEFVLGTPFSNSSMLRCLWSAGMKILSSLSQCKRG
ncbi:uncharacterized protein LOC107197294 isoform X1 [Astyanax mexicanus]|uniref:uncharacterized protein LOC107197294 isoform X1 n=1 Tax=Astyanax mexicanus TaxID=7994 RepID=UPI0020CAAC7A|nr:uncharacterized protein LOC107197294 isoform X1 [Astyanax mexicanus]